MARRVALLLAGIAFFTALIVQSGELGSSDTTHRLQTTHSLWTSEPPVFAKEYPAFGIHGRHGKLYSWYGIGQSLLMLPADVIGTYVENLPVFADYFGTDPTVRNIVVSYTTNILVCVLTCLVCFRLLGLLGFSIFQRFAGVLALLLGTTFLHYTQNMMENNYIALLTLTGLTFQYEWFRENKSWALAVGSIALGLNLLTRVTTAMDLLAVGFFLLVTAWLSNIRGKELQSRVAEYLRVALPVCAIFVLIERAYQFARFGSFFNTYIQVYGQEWKRLDPTLPAAFPFETPFHVGFFGALFSPQKSIFLFDPLLLLAALLTACAWKFFAPEIKSYLLGFGALVIAYVCFYAKFTDWNGDTSWGDRYVATAAQLVALIAVPLLLRHRDQIGKTAWRAGLAIVFVSVAIQISSVVFWFPLERYQMDTIDPPPTVVVWLRFKNIVAFALGKMTAWGLINDDMKDDAWDYAHITTLNFLPFLLKRVGVAPAWVVKLLKSIWLAAVAAWMALLGVAWRIVSKLDADSVRDSKVV